MALETGTYVDDFVSSNPISTDPVSQGDDHLRLIKALLQGTFPNADKAFYFATTVAKNATFTVDDAENGENTLYLVDASSGAVTAALPAAATAGAGFEVAIKKIDSSANAVTINPDGAETIEEAATFVLPAQFDVVVIRSDGDEWYVKASALSNFSDPVSFGDVALFADGAVGTPGISWVSDPDLGIYRIGSNNMGFAANGVLQGDVSASGWRFPRTRMVRRTSGATLSIADAGSWQIHDSASNLTYVLPALSGVTEGDQYFFKNINTGNCIVDGNSSEAVDGNTTSIVGPGQWGLLMAVNGAWEWVIRPAMELTLRDEKSNGTAAQSLAEGTWNTRVLQTVPKNTIGGASLSSNQVTLAPGTYKLSGYAQIWGGAEHKLRWFNVSDTSTVIVGANSFAQRETITGPDINQGDRAVIYGEFTITATKTFRLEHQNEAETASEGNALGGRASLISSVSEVYAEVFIEKIA